MVADNRNVFVTMTLRDQLTGKTKKIEGSLAKVRTALDQTSGRVKRTETSFISLTGNVLKAAPAFAVATGAIRAVYEAMRLLRSEFIGGLQAVEDYNLRVASMAGFITQFSRKGAEGNLVEAFKEANKYAGLLVAKLEIMDAKTIATGKDLTIMAETFLKNGQLLDIYNEKQVQGFINIANALKLVTQGQNQEIQMRQEINALMKGQLRPTDQLGRLIEKINPNIREQLKLWAAQGVVIERVGDMLFGMQAAGESIEKTWEAIGTSLATIHDRLLRGAFRPTYETLIELAEELRDTFVDINGELTETGIQLQENIKTVLEDIKDRVVVTYGWLEKIVFLVKTVSKPFLDVKWVMESISGFAFDIAKYSYETVENWITADPVLAEIERRYRNVDQYAKAIAEHALIMQGTTAAPFLPSMDIAGEIGLDTEDGVVPGFQRTIEASKAFEKFIKLKEESIDRERDNIDLVKLNAKYTKEVAKAWEDVTLAILPEHERKVESIIRKYDKLRDQALTIYGEEDDYKKFEERFRLLNESQDEAIVKLKETGKVAEDLGFTFSSAFEDAVIAGKELSDILKGLEQDIVRILMRKTITEPLANSLTAGINTAGTYLSGILSGGSTIGMARGGMITEPIFGVGSSGQTYRFGEGGIKERVSPVGESQGVVNHYTIDARGADAGVELRIRRAIDTATNAAYNKVASDMATRGPIRQSIGV